ncbi:hypothetical protein [Kitasatospora griseola]|uniref:hypothetical protein n=1 Tax=Kitasatospora griseola TaxID=2064 RepID=UPI003810F728
MGESVDQLGKVAQGPVEGSSGSLRTQDNVSFQRPSLLQALQNAMGLLLAEPVTETVVLVEVQSLDGLRHLGREPHWLLIGLGQIHRTQLAGLAGKWKAPDTLHDGE